jgi:hypothetical protein
MKQRRKTVMVILCIFILLFSVSGFMMTGSFSVSAPQIQKGHYIFMTRLYGLGSVVSLLVLIYLLFFKKSMP